MFNRRIFAPNTLNLLSLVFLLDSAHLPNVVQIVVQKESAHAGLTPETATRLVVLSALCT